MNYTEQLKNLSIDQFDKPKRFRSLRNIMIILAYFEEETSDISELARITKISEHAVLDVIRRGFHPRSMRELRTVRSIILFKKKGLSVNDIYNNGFSVAELLNANAKYAAFLKYHHASNDPLLRLLF